MEHGKHEKMPKGMKPPKGMKKKHDEMAPAEKPKGGKPKRAKK